jgi:DNA-directed RNA polymerase subunit K/omega
MMNDSPASKSGNSYEKVMVAAREARRLNDRVLLTRIEPKEKVTTLAIRRAQRDEVAFTYDEQRPEASDRAAADIFTDDGESSE